MQHLESHLLVRSLGFCLCLLPVRSDQHFCSLNAQLMFLLIR
nr:MAG TPA: hypothetical protein [Caudoviricetes sp.]